MRKAKKEKMDKIFIFFLFLGGQEFVGHSFAYVAHFEFLRDVWIRIQRAAMASRCATNLATHLPALPPPSLPSHLSPYFATQLPA
jgi:hypothetical protein